MTEEMLSENFETKACRSARCSSTFGEAIQRDRTVCDHCFSKVYEEQEDWIPDSTRESLKDVLVDPRYDGRKEQTEMVPDLRPYGGGETRSCDCGSVDFAPYNRPLKKAVFMEYAENLSQRLDENGYSHDEDRFLELCHDLKAEDEMKDDEIYCEVTEELTD